jgi:hypothetical protein
MPLVTEYLSTTAMQCPCIEEKHMGVEGCGWHSSTPVDLSADEAAGLFHSAGRKLRDTVMRDTNKRAM